MIPETRLGNSDLRLYYADTFLPVEYERADSGVGTFLIQDIRHPNNQSFDIAQAVCTGTIYYMEGGRVRREEGATRTFHQFLGNGFYNSHRDIGYVKFDGRPVWVTFRRRRTNRKGVEPSRLAGYTPGTNEWNFRGDAETYARMYATFDGRIDNNFCIHENNIHYKGVVVGTYSRRNRISLRERFAYLGMLLQNAGYDVTVEVE